MKKCLALLLLFGFVPAWAAQKFDGSPLKGEVLESINAGTYTYLHLKNADGDFWAAILKTDMPKGTNVMLHDPTLMTNFESRALNKTFAEIVFASAVSTETSSVQMPAAQMAAAHQGAASSTGAVPVETIAKAAGADARTVAETYAQKATLKGKTIAVRGKIVKYSSGIMDRNWIHLRDGSGAAGTNDLVVTTQQAAAVGDVITVRGAVRTDADFGSGYSYALLLENATLQK